MMLPFSPVEWSYQARPSRVTLNDGCLSSRQGQRYIYPRAVMLAGSIPMPRKYSTMPICSFIWLAFIVSDSVHIERDLQLVFVLLDAVLFPDGFCKYNPIAIKENHRIDVVNDVFFAPGNKFVFDKLCKTFID